MRSIPRLAQLAIAALAGAALAGGGYALASSSLSTIHGCINLNTRQLFVQKKCHRGQRSLTWDQQGPTGPRGATGQSGSPGMAGAQGPPGHDAVGQWEVVDSNGNRVAGTDFDVTHPATGSYELNKATGARTCGVQVTPNNNSNGVTVPPIIASVFNGFPVQIVYLTDTTGHGVDDGFSVTVQC